MVKNINKKEKNTNKILKILSFSLLLVICLVGIFITGIYVFSTVFENYDHNKFIKLDKNMQSLYEQIKSEANEGDDWKYIAVCSKEYTGDFPTGDYNCVTSISMQKRIASVDELNELQAKYYPIIDNSEYLKEKSEIKIQLPNDFGINFVVSSAEKRYEEKNTGFSCRYIDKVFETDENGSYIESQYGTNIDVIGGAVVSLKCTGKTSEAWYKLSDNANLLIP